MLRALWFMVKVGALVALVVWIAERPGFVRLEWMEYVFTIHVGLFLVMALTIILAAIFIYSTIKTFVGLPASLRRYSHVRNQEKGYQALTIGLTAVAAGDTKAAVKQAKRAEKYLKGDTGLPLLLKAQSARLDGREDDALENFAALIEDKNAAFLGVRGLLQAALDHQDDTKALALANHALKLHPKQPWILRVAYDLHVQLRQWDAALAMLARAEKAKALEADQARADRVAILLSQAQEQDNKAALKLVQKAVKLDEGFAPAAVRLARLYLSAGQRRKAVAVVRAAWKAAPHPDLMQLWILLISPKKAGVALARMRWVEELAALKADAVPGQIAAALTALDEKLWGEARNYLLRAAELEPSVRVYQLLADLEERSGQGKKASAIWQEKALHAAADFAWVCRDTGRIYGEWAAIAAPHGAFNTMEWTQPQGFAFAPAQLDIAVGATSAVLDLPAS